MIATHEPFRDDDPHGVGAAAGDVPVPSERDGHGAARYEPSGRPAPSEDPVRREDPVLRDDPARSDAPDLRDGSALSDDLAPGQAVQDLFDWCEQLLASELTFPFGPEPAVFKIGGRIFALFSGHGTVESPDRVSLKCDPELAAALVRRFEAVQPGYHLNKRHWITVDIPGDLPEGLLEELVTESYDLVVDKLPRARRPLARDRRATPWRDLAV